MLSYVVAPLLDTLWGQILHHSFGGAELDRLRFSWTLSLSFSHAFWYMITHADREHIEQELWVLRAKSLEKQKDKMPNAEEPVRSKDARQASWDLDLSYNQPIYQLV